MLMDKYLICSFSIFGCVSGVSAGAQDVRVRGAREHVVAAGGCSSVLACQIRVRLHRRDPGMSMERKRNNGCDSRFGIGS